MLHAKTILGIGLAAVLVAVPGWSQASQSAQVEANHSSSLDQVADKVSQRELQEVSSLRKYTPLVEIYIQDVNPSVELGKVPSRDEYFLGKASLANGVVFRPLVGKTGFRHTFFKQFSSFFSRSYNPQGFLRMIYPDTNGFDRAHYDFQYVRREFLGDVRCIVLDVTPKKSSGRGRFKGRLWVEDQDFTIVRFNGVFVPNTMFGWYFHFDSWRVNAGGMWLPAYVYTEETDLKSMMQHIRFKGQVRLWGYNQSPALREEELGRILVESSAPMTDQAEAKQDYSPVQSERAFEREAEDNTLDRLERAGLMAPRGDVDKVLETVMNNLQASNNLDIQPEVHCRVLLTSTLEEFTVGHSIVLSRGLIDVLPDEASLATMLAQELAEIALGHQIDTKYAFSDRLLFQDKDTFHVLNFRETQKEVDQASQKAVTFLKNSPYKDQLGNAGLFLKILDARSKQLPNLISPRLGDRVYEIQALMSSAPQLEMTKLDQVAALPLGSRVKVNPWNDQIEMMKNKPVRLLSAKEKMPFEIAPVYLYVTREGAANATKAQKLEPAAASNGNADQRTNGAQQATPKPAQPDPPENEPQ